MKGQELYKNAKKIIPGGTQLLSKRPEMWLPEYWPSYYSKAKGCEVWDLDDNHYYDLSLMGVGANVLGYAFDEVDEVAKEAISKGGMCTLNAPEEVELAEKMIELHPWADMVRYSKTGGESLSIAIRIARACMRKDIVLVCGYHGWHDWYLAANLQNGDPLSGVHLKGLEPTGVPRGLSGTNYIFHYNNIMEFRTLIETHRGNIAAVVMEPVRNDEPLDGFLEEIREVTKEEKIVLIFDEVSSGFRICDGGSHKKYGVEPDLATFAKAMTNGYPLSVVLGKAEIMQAAQDTFISSTYWTERIALAATIKSIECFKKYNVSEHLLNVGMQVENGWKEIAKKNNLNIHINGIYPIIHFDLDCNNPLAYKTFFTQEMLKEGYLAGFAVYASYAHTNEIISDYIKACDRVFNKISDIQSNGDDINKFLRGSICHAGFERLN